MKNNNDILDIVEFDQWKLKSQSFNINNDAEGKESYRVYTENWESAYFRDALSIKEKVYETIRILIVYYVDKDKPEIDININSNHVHMDDATFEFFYKRLQKLKAAKRIQKNEIKI